jgi:hypothetical protein
MRSKIVPTDRQAMRIIVMIAVVSHRWASQPTSSTKCSVERDSGSAQLTCSTMTPQRRHSTRHSVASS